MLRSSNVCHRCHFETEKDGERTTKTYKFHCSAEWIGHVDCGCRCTNGHQRLTSSKDGKVTGNCDLLTESAAYPVALGQAIIKGWMSARDAVPVRVSMGAPRSSFSKKRSWTEIAIAEDRNCAPKPRFWQQL